LSHIELQRIANMASYKVRKEFSDYVTRGFVRLLWWKLVIFKTDEGDY